MILVLDQSPLSTIFSIVLLSGSTKIVLSGYPLYCGTMDVLAWGHYGKRKFWHGDFSTLLTFWHRDVSASKPFCWNVHGWSQLEFVIKLVSSWTTKVYFLFNHKQVRSKVPILLYFVRPKRSSGNCYESCFITEKTPLTICNLTSKTFWLHCEFCI